jgi:hypothetical protein
MSTTAPQPPSARSGAAGRAVREFFALFAGTGTGQPPTRAAIDPTLAAAHVRQVRQPSVSLFRLNLIGDPS